MYLSAYREMAEETAASIRSNERQAFARSIELLKRAQAKGRGSRESVEALLFVHQLWTLLLEDLAHEGNGLPDSLKASIISVGIWVLRRSEDIRQGKTEDFTALIDVSQTISLGLKGH
jgi:flagellar protein FlaF